jgi:hypothetical protein
MKQRYVRSSIVVCACNVLPELALLTLGKFQRVRTLAHLAAAAASQKARQTI